MNEVNRMKILVLFNSRGGNTHYVAETIAQASREHNHDVKIKSIVEVQSNDIEQADMLFIGTWVQGFILFGVKPADATLWVPSLPFLAGKPIAIFCTYAFNPRDSLKKLGTLLETQGAQIISQQAFHRNCTFDDVKLFVENVNNAVHIKNG